MGISSSKANRKQHFVGNALQHHDAYWLSQHFADGSSCRLYNNHLDSSHGRKHFHMNEHDPAIYASQSGLFEPSSPPLAFTPSPSASSSSLPSAQARPPPPPQLPTTITTAHSPSTATTVHLQDYHDSYQASVSLGHSMQPHMPIYEDTTDLYIEQDRQLYNSNLHLDNASAHQRQAQRPKQISSRRSVQVATLDNPLISRPYYSDQAPSVYSNNSNQSSNKRVFKHVQENLQSPRSTQLQQSQVSSAWQYKQQQQQQSRQQQQQQQHKYKQQVNRRRKLVVAQHKRAHFERGLAMNEEDRKRNGQLGLLPAAVQDQELQSRAVLNFIDNCQDELAKYMYLRNLKDFNEHLFYYTLINNVEKLMPLVYTPTVGLACQKFSEIYMRPRGLFVTMKDLGRVRQVVANWPEKDVRVIVVTDGERILGLGDLGANGMGISIGKLSLYTALAGIPPQNVLPVTIDVGTNNEKNLKDPFYIGLRQQRVRGEKYDQLIEEFMQAVVERWGRSCLIQFEDFANTTAFTLLKRYRNDFCTFNDDIQGTASVSLSGLLTGARLIGKRLGDCKFLFYGAGEANLGTASLLIMAMQDEGLSKQEAKERIYLVDSKGLVVNSRSDLNEHKLCFAHDTKHLRDLEEIVDFIKPTALIGASAQGGSFTESICKKMTIYNERPLIFALSNPTSKAECTAAQAYEWTNAKCVFASGSPFDPVKINGRTYVTGQGNNAYIFPGVGLAAIAAHTHIVPEQTFLVAARALSDQVTGNDIEVGLIYPSLSKIREVTLRVALRCLEYFYSERLANYFPEPNDKEEFLKTLQYDPKY